MIFMYIHDKNFEHQILTLTKNCVPKTVKLIKRPLICICFFKHITITYYSIIRHGDNNNCQNLQERLV